MNGRRPASSGIGSVASVGGVLDAAAQFVSYGNTNAFSITLGGSVGGDFGPVSVPLGRQLAFAGNSDEVLMLMAWSFPYRCNASGNVQWTATVNPPGGSGLATAIGPLPVAALLDTRTWPTMLTANYVPRSRFTPGNWTAQIIKSNLATVDTSGLFAQGIVAVIG